jgi:hypothetical protein
MTYSARGCEEELRGAEVVDLPITGNACGPEPRRFVTSLCRHHSDEDGTEDGEIHDEDGEIAEGMEEASVIDVDSCSVEIVDTRQSSQASDDFSACNQDCIDAIPADPSQQYFLPSPGRDSSDDGDSEDHCLSNVDPATSVTNHVSCSGLLEKPSFRHQSGCDFPNPVLDSPATAIADNPRSSVRNDVPKFPLTHLTSHGHSSFPLVHPAMSYLMQGTPPPLPPPSFLSLPPHFIPGFVHHLHSFPLQLENGGRNRHSVPGTMQAHSFQMMTNAHHAHAMQNQVDFVPSRQLSPPLSPPCYQGPASTSNYHDVTSCLRPSMTVDDGKTSSRNCNLTTHREGDAWTRPDAEIDGMAGSNGARHPTCTSHIDDISDKRSIQNRVRRQSGEASALKRKASVLQDVSATRGDENEPLSELREVPDPVFDASLSSPSSSECRDTPSAIEAPDAKEPKTRAPRRPIDLTAMKAAVLLTLRKQSRQVPIPSAQKRSTEQNDNVVFSCDEEDNESGEDSESDGSLSDTDCNSPTIFRHDRRKVSNDAKSCDVVPMVSSPGVKASRDTQALKRRELEDLRRRVKQKEEDLAIRALQHGNTVSNCMQNSAPSATPISKQLLQASQAVEELPTNARELMLREKQSLARRIAELESMRRKTGVESEPNRLDHSKLRRQVSFMNKTLIYCSTADKLNSIVCPCDYGRGLAHTPRNCS